MNNLPIVAHIDGEPRSRQDVRAWEHRRCVKVARRLGLDPSLAPEELARRVVDRKLELGHDALLKLLRFDLRLSAPASSFGGVVSRGRRRLATTTLSCPVGAVEHLPAWYHSRFAAGDERALLAASPDHWISRLRPDGTQEVFETTGGSPLVVRMTFGDDCSSLVSRTDPSYPTTWQAVALDARGTPIGGVLHRFRDQQDGFTAELNVEFPVTVPRYMIRQHCWHLAGEFSNWIEHSAAT